MKDINERLAAELQIQMSFLVISIASLIRLQPTLRLIMRTLRLPTKLSTRSGKMQSLSIFQWMLRKLLKLG